MEFNDVGTHCQAANCNQQDFLPFKCDHCSKLLCLNHKGYYAHGCDGDASKDITSIECPICKKSVKFTRDKNADDVWSIHYMSDCSQTATSEKPTEKCGLSGCGTVLGTSNWYNCPKCRLKVCLSHRLPEDHACKSLTGGSQSGRSQTDNSKQIDASKPKYRNNKPETWASSKKKEVDPSNTLRGSAERRIQNLQKSEENRSRNGGVPNHVTNSSSTLAQHRERDRTDYSQGNYSQSDQGLMEICPQCNARFGDTMQLIDHVETFHAHSYTSPGSRNNNSNSNGSSGGSQMDCSKRCSMS